jgi:glycosyltransferase involved in cell wall biosynthesis
MYDEARIFVFPSIQENFPIVLLEAMDAGCAVITTDAEGCAEVIGDTGIVIQKANPLEIRRSLVALMGDETLRNQLSRRAENRVQLFRWPLIADHYAEVFTAVLQNRRANIPCIGAPPPPTPAAPRQKSAA